MISKPRISSKKAILKGLYLVIGGRESFFEDESSFLEQSDEDYDIQALEALGMIRTERNAPLEDEIYDDVSVAANVDGGGLGGLSYITII